MKNSIKTEFGISSKTITMGKDNLWSGIVQGISSSGPSWLEIKSIMMEKLKHKYYGKTITSIDKKMRKKFTIIGYIGEKTSYPLLENNIR